VSDEFDFHPSTYHLMTFLTMTVMLMAPGHRSEVPLFPVSSVDRPSFHDGVDE
jgi:hypothetical protein